LTNWRVGAAFEALASWQVGVNGLASSIEVGITGGGLSPKYFQFAVRMDGDRIRANHDACAATTR
jgi:hypothetical protein